MQRTLALIKPDAFAAGHAGAIIAQLQASGLTVVAVKSLHLSRNEAEAFYRVHAERSFFGELVEFMCEGPIMALCLTGDEAIAKWRTLMGPTNATVAPPDTIRGRFGTSLQRNATHGSDAPQTAEFEVGFFFSGRELL